MLIIRYAMLTAKKLGLLAMICRLTKLHIRLEYHIFLMI